MIKVFLSLFLITAAVFSIARFALLKERKAPPCTAPIAYSVGYFDKRFHLSFRDFLAAIREAEAMWERSLGRDLFEYSEVQGDLSVNLIFDRRQEVTHQLNAIEDVVDQGQVQYQDLQKKHQVLKAEYNLLKSSYDAKLAVFESEKVVYDSLVLEWNEGNRTSKKDFEKVEEARVALESRLSEVKVLEDAVNAKALELNTMVGEINVLAKTLNITVENYNNIGASRGESFQDGLYISDETGERVEVYEFESRTKLIRTLAHELGHALGLDHLADRNAIMYSTNVGESLRASPADTAALKKLCGVLD